MKDSQVTDRPVMHWISAADGRGGFVLQAVWSVHATTTGQTTHVHAA